MIKKDFWENIAEIWAKKETIDIPPIDIGTDLPPDDLNDDEIDFDDIDDIDEFFKDMLNGI